MRKRYLDYSMFYAAIRYISRRHELTQVHGSHWVAWYLNGKQIASACYSPHPGPEYGSMHWVDRDLTKGAEVAVRHSRPINATEAHIINERIGYERQYHRPQPANQLVQLIPEVEAAYFAIQQNGGFKTRVGVGSFYIYWNECVMLD